MSSRSEMSEPVDADLSTDNEEIRQEVLRAVQAGKSRLFSPQQMLRNAGGIDSASLRELAATVRHTEEHGDESGRDLYCSRFSIGTTHGRVDASEDGISLHIGHIALSKKG